MDWTEIDKVLDETRAEARRKLLAAGFNGEPDVRVFCYRDRANNAHATTYCTSIYGPVDYIYGDVKPTSEEAVNSTVDKWRAKTGDAKLMAEFEAWKAQRDAQTQQ